MEQWAECERGSPQRPAPGAVTLSQDARGVKAFRPPDPGCRLWEHTRRELQGCGESFTHGAVRAKAARHPATEGGVSLGHPPAAEVSELHKAAKESGNSLMSELMLNVRVGTRPLVQSPHGHRSTGARAEDGASGNPQT